MDAVMEKEKQYTWWLVTKFSGGHRVWFDRKSRRYSVADESGDIAFRYGKPSDTDDGVLWLNPIRPIVTAEPGEFMDMSAAPILSITASVPVINDQGDPCYIICEGPELAWFAFHFRWTIQWGAYGTGRLHDAAHVDLGYPKGTRRRRQPEPLNFCRKEIIKE